MKKAKSLFIILLFLSSCASKDAPKTDIENNVTKSFLTSSKNLSSEAPSDNWWLEFNDATLEKLVNLGLENNKDVQIATASIVTARELNKIEVSQLMPTVAASAGRQKFASPVFGPNGVKYDIYQVGFDVAWEVDFLGKNLDLARAGKLRFLKEAQLYKALALTVTSEITRNYIEMRAAQKQISNLLEISNLRKKLIKIAQEKERNGVVLESDVENAKIDFNTTLNQISELEISQKLATFRLAVLTGMTPDQIMKFLKKPQAKKDEKKILNYQSGILPTGLKSDILWRRPDIIAADYELEAAGFDKRAQFKEFFPSFNFTATIAGASKNLGDVFKDGANMKNINGFISVPIFEGGRLVAQYKITKAKEKIAVLNYENTVLKALEECELELVRYINNLQIETAVKEQLQSVNKIFQISQNRNRHGAITKDILLNAKISVLGMENNLVAKKAQTLTSLISFHKAIGGGFAGYKIKFKKDKVSLVEEKKVEEKNEKN